MSEQTMMMIAIAVVAVVVVVAVWMLSRRRKTAALRARFGPEYDHVLRSTRTPAEAERELLKRQSRVEAFSIKPLSREDADRFSARAKMRIDSAPHGGASRRSSSTIRATR